MSAGEDGLTATVERAEEANCSRKPQKGSVRIREFDISPQAGAGAYIDEHCGLAESHVVLGAWEIPKIISKVIYQTQKV